MTPDTLTGHPARKAEVEAWLDERGIPWTFDPELAIDQVDVRASLRNQARHEPLDPEVVDRYTEDLKRGDIFPAVLANTHAGRVVMLGGNHRLHGHIAAKRTTIAAYLVDVEDPGHALRLAYEDNRKHGKPPSTEERVQQALHLCDNGWTQADAAAAVGIAAPHISMARTRQAARRRAIDNDVTHEWDDLGKSIQVELGRVRSDPVFAAAVSLTAVHNLGVVEVKDLCKELAASKSDQQAIGLIGMRQEAAEDRARAARNGTVGPTARSKLQNALAAIERLSVDEILASCPPETRTALRRQIRRTAKRLADIDGRL